MVLLTDGSVVHTWQHVHIHVQAHVHVCTCIGLNIT